MGIRRGEISMAKIQYVLCPCLLPLGLSCCRKPERGTSGRCKVSAPCRCSALVSADEKRMPAHQPPISLTIMLQAPAGYFGAELGHRVGALGAAPQPPPPAR